MAKYHGEHPCLVSHERVVCGSVTSARGRVRVRCCVAMCARVYEILQRIFEPRGIATNLISRTMPRVFLHSELSVRHSFLYYTHVNLLRIIVWLFRRKNTQISRALHGLFITNDVGSRKRRSGRRRRLATRESECDRTASLRDEFRIENYYIPSTQKLRPPF